MGDGNDTAWVLGEVALEPADGLGVQVVRGLVEQQQVGLAQQQLAQGHPPLFTAGEVGDRGVRVGDAEGVHGDLEGSV